MKFCSALIPLKKNCIFLMFWTFFFNYH
uniref:Uncharacterized protein n=1 Tax=Arundo donax TaxID=35708 RepID=A0A0A9BLR8_ARUDO